MEAVHEALFILPLTKTGTAGGASRWVFKSWVDNAGDVRGLRIYRGSNQRSLAREAACQSTILKKVLTRIRCWALQDKFWADRLVCVPDRKSK